MCLEGGGAKQGDGRQKGLSIRQHRGGKRRRRRWWTSGQERWKGGAKQGAGGRRAEQQPTRSGKRFRGLSSGRGLGRYV